MKNKLGKKLLALILCVPLLFSLASPLTAFGASEVYGILTNNNNIYNCDSNGQNQGTTQIPLGDVTHLFIASDVDRVFNNISTGTFKNLVSLTIPPNVRVIEDTFVKSPRLENIDFSKATGLESIKGYAFAWCGSLKTVDLSKAINLRDTSRGFLGPGMTFFNCANLETVILPKSLKELDGNMFESCYKLADVTFGSKLPPTIGMAAFGSTKDKIRIHLLAGSNVNEWETAFLRAGASNPVFIVNNKYGIYKSDGNVYECNENAEATATTADKNSLAHLFIASDVTKINDSAFFGCNQLIDVDFSKAANLKTIGTSAFSSCTGLETIRDFPQSVTEINANAFANCKGLESFDLTNAKSLTSMGDAAFSGCESLKTMAIPDSVKTIGHGAFYNCQSLSSVNFFNQNPPQFQENSPDVPQGASFGNTKDGINVFLPSGANENNWRQKLIAAGMTNPVFFTVDRVPPTASIKVGDKAYNQVTDPITFDTLLKDKAEITITANDVDSGIKNIEYQEVSSEADYKAEGTWKSYTQKFDISNRGKNIIYVRATDSAGNQTIINTNGFIIYNDSQLQTEITEFDKKEGNQKDILVKVNLNGNTLKNITNGETVLKSGSDYIINDSSPAKKSVSPPESGLTLAIQKSYLAKLQSGIQTLTFNFNPYGVEGGLVLNTPLEITIKETGHTHEFNAEFTIDKAATCTEKGEKSRHCKDFALCGGKTDITKIELAPHTGGVANCHAKAICSVCNNGYGEIDPNKHDGGTEVKKIKLPTHKEEGYSGDTYCKGCNAVLKLGKVFSKTPHTTSPGWHHDEKSHWHECTGCDEKVGNAEHIWATEASKLASCTTKPGWLLMELTIASLKEEYDKNNDTKFQNPIYYFCPVCDRVKKEEYKFYEKIHDVTTGDNLVYEFGTIGGATFTSDANINDFLGVGIDDKAMKFEDIKVKAGSTIVTISSEYMDTLSNGKHTVSIYSTTGTATATFTVKGEESLNPSTGDNGNMPLWISLVFVSGGALLLFGISKKRRKVNEK